MLQYEIYWHLHAAPFYTYTNRPLDDLYTICCQPNEFAIINSWKWEQVQHNCMLQGANGKTSLYFPVPVSFEVVMGLRCV